MINNHDLLEFLTNEDPSLFIYDNSSRFSIRNYTRFKPDLSRFGGKKGRAAARASALGWSDGYFFGIYPTKAIVWRRWLPHRP